MVEPVPDLFRVTLLGTGAPPPLLGRFGPSTLIEAGDQKFIFDADAAPCSGCTNWASRLPISPVCCSHTIIPITW